MQCLHTTFAGFNTSCMVGKKSHLPSAPSYTVGTDADGDLGLYDPSVVRGPVVACQTQEIPLLLLHSSVVATCLCVYFGGAVPASVCPSPFLGWGLTVLQIHGHHSPRGRRQGQLNKHGPFLRTLSVGHPTGSLFLFHPSCHLPHSTFEAVEALASDL